MIASAALAALRQTMSPPLRGILLRSLGLTVLLLAAIWAVLTRGVGYLLEKHPLSVDYPIIDGFVWFMTGAGLIIVLLYLLPAVSAVVGSFFLDDAAEIVEQTDFPGEATGAPVPTGASILYGLRFAGLALLVNLCALTLFFIPVVNVAAFFVANTYLLSREYFEMAAARFRSMPEAAALRREHRATVLGAGALLAGLMLVPVLNLVTPVFGIALMVHLNKRIGGRRAIPGPGGTTSLR